MTMLKSVWVTDSENTPLSVTLQFNLNDPTLERRREAVGVEEGGRYIVVSFASEADAGTAWSNHPALREILTAAHVTHVGGVYPGVTLTIPDANLDTLGFTDEVTAFAARDGRREQSGLPVTVNHLG